MRSQPSFGSVDENLNSFMTMYGLLDQGSYSLALLYSHPCREKMGPFFEKVREIISTEGYPTGYKWAMSCFSDRFANLSLDFSIDELWESLLSAIPDPMLVTIKPFLLGQKEVREIMEVGERNFGFFLLLLLSTSPALFRVLKPRFQKYVEHIGKKKLIQSIGVPAISLFTSMKKEDFDIELGTIDLIELTDATEDFDILKSIQNVYAETCSYPLDFPIKDAPAIVSLMNSSIHENMHFVDVLAKEIGRKILTGDINSIPYVARTSTTIVPFIMLAHQPFIYKNLSKFTRLINAELPESAATVVQRRMRNDISVMKMISFATGTQITVDDLATHSLPYLLGNGIHMKEVLDCANRKCFIYSDEEWQRDYDFIHYYRAISRCLDLLPLSIMTTGRSQKLWTELTESLDSVKNEETKKKLALELFCLVFLKKDGKYVCTTQFAKQLIHRLRSVENHLYYRYGLNSLDSTDYDLQIYMGTNRMNMIRAMTIGKWREAELMSRANTDYRRDYVISYGIQTLLKDGSVPIECGDYQVEFSIETGFATVFSKECLPNAIDSYPQFKSLIEYRMKTPEDELLVPVSTNNACKDVVDQFEAHCETYVADGVSFEATKEYKHVYELIESMKLFYKCSVLCNKLEQKSFNEIIQLIPQKAVAGAVNSNNMDLAMKITNKFNLDLFEFVVHNLEWFDTTADFVKRFYSQYKLECIALGVTSLAKEELTELKMPKMYTKFVSEKKTEPSEEVLFLTAVTALENPATPLEFYDDILFRIDHAKFCAEIVHRIDRIPEEKATALLDIVGYTMTDALKTQISTFLVKRQVYMLTKTKDVLECVNILLEKREIQLLASYLDVLEDKCIEYLLHSVKQLINEKQILRTLIAKFPEHHEFLVKQMDEIVPDVLVVYSGPDFKKFRAFSLLPLIIRRASTLKSTRTIVQAICDNIKVFEQLKEVHLCLFTVDDLVTMLDACARRTTTPQFISQCLILLHFAPKSIALIEFILTKLSAVVDSISVYSEESEQAGFMTLNSIHQFCQTCDLGSAFTRKVSALQAFVFRKPYCHVKLPYHLGKNPEQMLKVCFAYDLDQCAMEIGSIFKLDMTQYVLHRAYVPMILHQFASVAEIISTFEKQFGKSQFDITKFDKYDHVYTRHKNEPKMSEYDMLSKNSPFLLPYYANPVFRPEAIEVLIANGIACLTRNGNPGELPIYRDIKFQCKRKGRTSSRIGEKQQNAIFFFRRFSCLESQVALFVAFNDLDNLLPSLLSVTDTEERKNIFLRKMIHTAVCYEMIRTIEKVFYKLDRTLLVTGELWEHLAEFGQRREMYTLLMDLYSFMGRLEESALASLQIFKHATSMSRKLSVIGVASICLSDSVRFRITPDPTHTPVFRPSDKTLEYIMEMQKLVDIQKDVCTFLYRKGVELGSSIDLINVDSAPLRVAAALFLHMSPDDPLLHRVMEEFQITMKMLYRNVSEEIKDSDIEVLLSFVEMRKNDPEFATDVMPELLHAMASSSNIDKIPVIMDQAKIPPVAAIKYFLDYNFLEQAFCVVSDNRRDKSVKPLIPLLAHKASQIGHQLIAQKCSQML